MASRVRAKATCRVLGEGERDRDFSYDTVTQKKPRSVKIRCCGPNSLHARGGMG